MTELPTYHGVCPYCASAVSCVTRDGMTYARCSHRGCGARGPYHRDLVRAVEWFTGKPHPKAPAQVDPDRIYPCDRCGTMRTKAEGGTIFAVCDECWDATMAPAQDSTERRGYVHATTPPGPRHARVVEPAQDAPSVERCEECRGIGWDALSRSDCGACNGMGRKVPR